jgi:lipid kinase YegS
MASTTCLILHRKSANEPAVKQAVRDARRAGNKIRVRIPWNKRDKPRVVKEALAAGARRIIAGGGDGTINAVVNGLVGKGKKPVEATLGILPLGTANDFARGLDLPVENLSRCLQLACTLPPRLVDVGRANGRSFINVTSAGFGAEITATTPVELKKMLGKGAYTIMGMAKALNLEPYEGRLLVPGEEAVQGAMLLMAVGNNRLAGGGFEVAPQAKLDDGLLDLAVVRYTPEMSIRQALAELNDPTAPGNDYIRYRQLREFTIEGKRDIHFNLDGEPVLASTLAFSVLPKHLGVAF